MIPASAVRALVAVLRFVPAATALVGCFGCVDNLSMKRGESDAALSTTTIPSVAFDAVYVVNGEGPSVSVIDAERNEVAGTIRLGGVAYPHQVTVSPDGALLGIAVPGYDLSSGESGHEHHSSREGHVLLIDAVTGTLTAAKRLDAANNNVAFSPDGLVWTSQATQPGSTLILDRELNVRETIRVGGSPTETLLTRDGGLAYITNSGSATVSVIDIAKRTVKATIPVGAGPSMAQPGPDGRVYVLNEIDQSISVIDSGASRVERTLPLDFRPSAVVPDEKGKLWLTSAARGGVEVRSEDGDVLRFVETGRGANSVAFSPDGTRAYVSNLLEDTVSVVDRSSFTATVKIPVGARPNGLAWRSR